MKKYYLTLGIVGLLILTGTAAYLGCQRYIALQQATCDRLTAAGNCQIDTISPFIRAHKLARVAPAPGSRSDFEGFLYSQVQVGVISDDAVRKVLTDIRAQGQMPPVFTSRGWIMPDLVQSN